jgi:phage virion morphogenesis protein
VSNEFQFELQGLEEAQAAFTRMIERSQRLRPLMADISEGLLHSTQDRFDAGIGPDGVAWAPSDMSRKKTQKTLVERGYLSGLLRPDFGDDFAGVSTAPLPYAPIHQWGGQAGRGRKTTIEARPYLGLSADDEAMITDLANAYVGADA